MSLLRLRRLSRFALAAFPLAVLGGLIAAPAQAAQVIGSTADDPAADHRGRYVALGDSYASGFGLPPYSKSPVPGCFQTHIDYPHRVAELVDLELTDVTCTGAFAVNIIDTPQKSEYGFFAPPQSDALNEQTEVVTLQIGGNDLGFSTVLPQCLAASAAGPLLADPSKPNCESELVQGGFDGLLWKLHDVVLPTISATLEKIVEKAPYANVVVVGYPSIFPSPENTPEGGCFVSLTGDGTGAFPQNTFPFTDVDTAYFHRTQAALEAGLAEVAAKYGATFAPAMAGSAGHEPCANNPDAWITGLTLTVPPAMRDGGLHPNEAGVEFLADQVASAVAGD